MENKLEENILLEFQKGLMKSPTFVNENERKVFLQFQKYNIIYMNPDGDWVISRRGKEALKYGVKKFLTLERFEEKLVKKSLNRETERKWIFFAIIPLILILTIALCIRLGIL